MKKILILSLIAVAAFGQVKAEKEPAKPSCAEGRLYGGDVLRICRAGKLSSFELGCANPPCKSKFYDPEGRLISEVTLSYSNSSEPIVIDYMDGLKTYRYDTMEHARAAAQKIIDRWNNRMILDAACMRDLNMPAQEAR